MKTNTKDDHSPGHCQHHCCGDGAFILSGRSSPVSLKIRHVTLIVLRMRNSGDLNVLVFKWGKHTFIVWVFSLGFHGKKQCRVCISVISHDSISFHN